MRIAITGRPNVGKSTLFNRLTGARHALVNPLPGLTRDKREGRCLIGGQRHELIDMPGYAGEMHGAESGSKAAHKMHHGRHDDELAARMDALAKQAATEADLCLFMIDARAGILPADKDWARFLHRQSVPVVLIANKCEGIKAHAGLADAHGLGFGEVIEFSAEHGLGFDSLEQAITRHLAAMPTKEQPPQATPTEMTLAIFGRPNSGKSTLANRLLGEERMLTGPEQGITRDSLFFPLCWQGRAMRLADTGGLRRKARMEGKAEQLTVGSALGAMRASQVVILLMDATKPYEKQDMHLAALIEGEGKAPLIVLNKSDLLDKEAIKAQCDEGAHVSALIPGTRILPISAKTGDGAEQILPAAFELYDAMQTTVGTGALNRWLREASEKQPVPGRRRFKYAVQVGTCPPQIAIFANRPGALPSPYRRYLAQSFRARFGLPGLPIRFSVRTGANPYAATTDA